MRRLLWALALAVPLAACGDDGVDELDDVDAAAEARDEGCFAVVFGWDLDSDEAFDEWTVLHMWRDDEGRLRGGEEIAPRIATEAEACAFACEWEAEHCGGARPDCGAHPEASNPRCTDG